MFQAEKKKEHNLYADFGKLKPNKDPREKKVFKIKTNFHPDMICFILIHLVHIFVLIVKYEESLIKATSFL